MLAELRRLAAIRRSERPWFMPLASALSTGLPFATAAQVGTIEDAIVAAFGGLVCLYLPDTSMRHRMVTMLSCTVGMAACYALGLWAGAVGRLVVPVLGAATMLAAVLCRRFAVGPAGVVFFVMAATVGAYSPWAQARILVALGWFLFGGLSACLVAFWYSRYALRRRAPRPVSVPLPERWGALVFDAAVIGALVAACLLIAQGLELERPYWVPISCLAVVQGGSLRDVLHRKIHRLLGTVVGLLVASGLLALPLAPCGIAVFVALLTFFIETAIVRHYAVAVVFITPLTILMSEAAMLSQAPHGAVIQARLIDTLLGCTIGLVGGIGLQMARLGRARSA